MQKPCMYTKNAHYLYTHNIYCVYPIYMHEISSSPALLGNFWESAKVKAASRLECVAAAAVRGAASGWVEPRGCAFGKKAH